jgi:peptide deformylase
MALRRIIKFPDPILRQPTTAVGDVAAHADLKKLVADMTDTMYAANGAGLAAIQVGDTRRLFIVEASIAGGAEGDAPKVFIDPEITMLSPETEATEEGCLSFPGIYLDVKRSLRATIRATGLDGKLFEVTAEGLFARALQHENDHLTGKLLVDFAGPLKKKMIKRRMEKVIREELEEAEAIAD